MSGSDSSTVIESGGCSSGAAWSPRHASSDQRDSPDSAEPRLANDSDDNAEPNDPTEPMDRTDPQLPIDRIEYEEPIDRIDRSEAIDRIERWERSERREFTDACRRRRCFDGMRDAVKAMLRSITPGVDGGRHEGRREKLPAAFREYVNQGTATRPTVGRKVHERGSAPSSCVVIPPEITART